MSTRRLSMNETLKNARIFDSDSDEESFIAALKKEKESKGRDANCTIEISNYNVEVCNIKKEVIDEEDSSSTASIEKTLLKAIHIKQEVPDNDETIQSNISACESKKLIHIKTEKLVNTDELIHANMPIGDSREKLHIKSEKSDTTNERIYACMSGSRQTFDASRIKSLIQQKKDENDTEEEGEAETSIMDIEMQTPVKKEHDFSDSLENETLSGLYIITPAKAETSPNIAGKSSTNFKDVIVAKRRLNKPDSKFSHLEKIDEQSSQASSGVVNNFFTRKSTRNRGSPYKLPENDNNTSLVRRGLKRESPYKRPDEVTRDTPIMKRNTTRYYEELNKNIDHDQIIPRKRFKIPEVEADPEVLARRQKQIDFGKNTIGYDNYIRLVSIQNRDKNDPQTPDKYRKYSRRGWDGLIRQWRIQLHKYDPEPCGDEDQ